MAVSSSCLNQRRAQRVWRTPADVPWRANVGPEAMFAQTSNISRPMAPIRTPESHRDTSDDIVLQKGTKRLASLPILPAACPRPRSEPDASTRERCPRWPDPTEAWFQPADAVVTELVGPVGGQALREKEVRRQVQEAKSRGITPTIWCGTKSMTTVRLRLPVASESSSPVPVTEDRRASAAR